MSSFDFADNFSGFNDLFNRAEFLTEAKKSPYAKYHPSFGGVTKDLRSAGFSSAPLDTINFIRTTLYDLELISDDELAAAKQGAGFAAKKNNLLALLDAKADVIEQNKDDIAAAIEDGLARYINRATTNRGKEEKYAAQKAALELAKDIKAGEDVGDAVEDTVGQLDAAESELAQSLQMSKEDPTTFIEIKIRDADRVEDVGNIVSKYANEDGLDISGDTVQFSVDPDTPLAKAVTAHGIDKIEAALKRDVDKISDSVVVVMSPDEDYEEMGYGFDSPEEPDEYSMGEEGGGITEVEDAEDLDHFLTKEQPEDYIPSTDYEDVIIDKEKNSTWGHGGIVDQLENVLAIYKNRLIELPPGHPDEDSFEEIIKKANRLRESILVWDKLPPDAPERLAKTNPPFLAGMFLDQLKDMDDPGHIDDMRAEYPPDPFGGGYEDEETLEEQYIIVEGVMDDLERLASWGPRGAAGIAKIFKSGSQILGTGMDAVKKVWDTVTPIVTKAAEWGKEGADEIVDAAKNVLDAYNEFKAGYKEGLGENEEDAIVMQPMLESHKTNTSAYLTEQAASDKRNKKTEVKNQSFKEKYKPKTHWQLEELRRYGL